MCVCCYTLVVSFVVLFVFVVVRSCVGVWCYSVLSSLLLVVMVDVCCCGVGALVVLCLAPCACRRWWWACCSCVLFPLFCCVCLCLMLLIRIGVIACHVWPLLRLRLMCCFGVFVLFCCRRLFVCVWCEYGLCLLVFYVVVGCCWFCCLWLLFMFVLMFVCVVSIGVLAFVVCCCFL